MNSSASRSFPGQALIVGISTYPDELALPNAVRRDAEDFAAMLSDPAVSGYPSERVSILLDEAGTTEAIRAGLERLARESRIGDTTVFYFSGHGEHRPASGLLGCDLDVRTGRPVLLSREELSEALSRIVSDRVIVILDACHSAGAATLKGPGQGLGVSADDLSHLSQGEGRVILSSSTAGQPSVVLPTDRNSLFTKHLLQGIKGAAFGRGETIGVLELYSYTNAAVRRERPEQTPVLKADIDQDLPIALRPHQQEILATTRIPAEPWELMAELYPLGPTDQHIWVRAGGDISRVRVSGVGRSDWFAAVKLLSLGGGGTITLGSLIGEALNDYPRHPALLSIGATLS